MTATNYEIEKVLQDFVDRRARGESPTAAEYVERLPHIADGLRAKFAVLEALDRSVTDRASRPPSETILGDFRVRLELGRGGMGVVFLAEQVSQDRLVALKLLGSPSAQRYDTVERFRREAAIASKLHHPNIVTVYAAGELHGYCFYAMQYVEGVTLGQLLARLREMGVDQLGSIDLARLASEMIGTHRPAATAGAEAPLRQMKRVAPRFLGYYGIVARLVSELADGLAYAHARGIIHRDVKPANILLSEDLVPQLADFGIARDVGQKTLSTTGDIVGTPHYMSPELVMAGRIPVDHRTDIYSLGVTLFELLSLTLPFRGTTSVEVLQKIALEPTPLPAQFNPSVPRDLQTIALKALEKDPGHRYATAAEMAEDLRRFLRFDPIRARMPGMVTRLLRRLKRHQPFVAAVLVLILVGSALVVWANRSAARSVTEARVADAESLEHRGSDSEPSPWRAARAIWAQLLADSGNTMPEAVEALRRIDQKIEGARAKFRGMATEALPHVEESEYQRGRAVMALDALLRLAPEGDDPALRSQRDRAWGIVPVTITSEPDGADIFLHPISGPSAAIGAKGERVGATPIHDLELPVGGHWVVVEKPGVGYGEYYFEVRRGDPTPRLHAVLRPTAEVIAEMLLVPAGRYRIGIDASTLGRPRLDEHEEQEVDVPAYFIDRTEVSNEEYARFVRETGYAAPPLWRPYGNSFKPGTERHPVTNVGWEDARRYAEWAGKRLPTEVEWEIACRGAESRLYPWGNEFVAAYATAPIKLEDRMNFSPEAMLEPVDSRPEGRSPFGLFHMADNAAEWVWDRWTGPIVGTPGAESFRARGERVTRGNWVYLRDGPACLPTVRGALAPEYRPTYVGFRCAKSKRP